MLLKCCNFGILPGYTPSQQRGSKTKWHLVEMSFSDWSTRSWKFWSGAWTWWRGCWWRCCWWRGCWWRCCWWRCCWWWCCDGTSAACAASKSTPSRSATAWRSTGAWGCSAAYRAGSTSGGTCATTAAATAATAATAGPAGAGAAAAGAATARGASAGPAAASAPRSGAAAPGACAATWSDGCGSAGGSATGAADCCCGSAREEFCMERSVKCYLRVKETFQLGNSNSAIQQNLGKRRMTYEKDQPFDLSVVASHASSQDTNASLCHVSARQKPFEIWN